MHELASEVPAYGEQATRVGLYQGDRLLPWEIRETVASLRSIQLRYPKAESAILLKSLVETFRVFVGDIAVFFIPLSEEFLHLL